MSVCALLSILPPLHVPPKDQMRSFLQGKADILPTVVAEARGRNVYREDADTKALKSAFSATPLTAVDGRAEDGHIVFYFQWSFNYGEATVKLMYLPANAYAAPSNDGWALVAESENAWRWEGGGMAGKGYIEAERLKDCWFYVFMYYPT